MRYKLALAALAVVVVAIAATAGSGKHGIRDDLRSALAAAEQANPPDEEAARCYRVLLDQDDRGVKIGSKHVPECDDFALRMIAPLISVLKGMEEHGVSLKPLLGAL